MINKDLKTVAVFNGMMEAQIFKAKLDDYGVENMLKFESAGRIMGITADGLGKVAVMVASEDLKRAEELFNESVDADSPEE